MSTIMALFRSSTEDEIVRENFERIYEDYWEHIFKQVLRILPDEDDVIDVVQQTFVDLWEIRDRIPGIKSIRSFLFIMARNLAFKRLKDRLKNENYRNSYVHHIPAYDLSSMHQLELKELDALLEDHINALPTKMREVFLLSRKEELSYVEIAQRLNITDGTVKKQVSNALKILRGKIDKDYISYLMYILLMDLL